MKRNEPETPSPDKRINPVYRGTHIRNPRARSDTGYGVAEVTTIKDLFPLTASRIALRDVETRGRPQLRSCSGERARAAIRYFDAEYGTFRNVEKLDRATMRANQLGSDCKPQARAAIPG